MWTYRLGQDDAGPICLDESAWSEYQLTGAMSHLRACPVTSARSSMGTNVKSGQAVPLSFSELRDLTGSSGSNRADNPAHISLSPLSTIHLTMTDSTTPLGPMPRLVLNKTGKPPIASWVAPPETKLDVKWQPLRVLDLSLLDGTPEQQLECQKTCEGAMMHEGFLLIENFGVEPEDVSRVGLVDED